MVLCGDCFTMAGTKDNTLYFWGCRSLQRARKASETDKTDSETNVKKHKRNASGSMSIGSADSLDGLVIYSIFGFILKIYSIKEILPPSIRLYTRHIMPSLRDIVSHFHSVK